jgi:uncharacterized protein (DUF1697 family)
VVARHIAFFRGINVGKAKRVAMADLRALVEGLGYRDVRTLLNSGNVVFSAGANAGAAATRIEKALAEKLGVTALVTVITAAELADIIDGNPLLKVADNHSRFLVAVLRDPTDRSKLEPLAKNNWAKERFALGSRVAYLWCPDGILESPLAVAVGKALKDAVTSRNWATMLKLHALAR